MPATIHRPAWYGSTDRSDDHLRALVNALSFLPKDTEWVAFNEELENWLLHLMEPKIGFRFFEVEYVPYWAMTSI